MYSPSSSRHRGRSRSRLRSRLWTAEKTNLKTKPTKIQVKPTSEENKDTRRRNLRCSTCSSSLRCCYRLSSLVSGTSRLCLVIQIDISSQNLDKHNHLSIFQIKYCYTCNTGMACEMILYKRMKIWPFHKAFFPQ